MRNRRREQVDIRKKRKRTILFTLGILIVFYLFLTMIFRENGLLRYVELRAVRADLQAEVRGIKKENKEIKRQIDTREKDPNLIEELARKEGLTKEDELIFKFEHEDEK